jgi:hypothetical protein
MLSANMFGLESILQRAESTLGKIQAIRSTNKHTADDEADVVIPTSKRPLYVSRDGLSADANTHDRDLLDTQQLHPAKNSNNSKEQTAAAALTVPRLAQAPTLYTDTHTHTHSRPATDEYNGAHSHGGIKFSSNCYDTQLKLLLDGLPDAYIDEELQRDALLHDKALERILASVGPKPSALVFPSLHTLNQHVLQLLTHVDTLRVSVHSLFVKSVKCMVRRKGTFLTIKPPHGVNTHTQTVIPLPELAQGVTMRRAEAIAQSSNSNRHTGGANSAGSVLVAERFFSGSVQLADTTITQAQTQTHIQQRANTQPKANHVDFPVKLSDELIKRWLSSDVADDCVRIELYSPLLSTFTHTYTHTQGTNSEAVLFAYTHVSLRGLLCSNALQAVATCPLRSEPTTQASILNRQAHLPVGRHVSAVANRQTPSSTSVSAQSATTNGGGSDLGVITVHISLCAQTPTDAQSTTAPANTQARNKQPPQPVAAPTFLSSSLPLTTPAPSVFVRPVVQDDMHDALDYVPTEQLELTRTHNVAHTQAADTQAHGHTQPSSQSNTPTQPSTQDCWWSVVVHAATATKHTEHTEAHTHKQQPPPLKLHVRYKTAVNTFHAIPCTRVLSTPASESVFVHFGDCGIHHTQQTNTHTQQFRAPILELWTNTHTNTHTSAHTNTGDDSEKDMCLFGFVDTSSAVFSVSAHTHAQAQASIHTLPVQALAGAQTQLHNVQLMVSVIVCADADSSRSE